MSIDASRYTYLCEIPDGRFYWDAEDKMMVIERRPGEISGAGAYVVSQDINGRWCAKRRPAPRLDLDVLRAERDSVS